MTTRDEPKIEIDEAKRRLVASAGTSMVSLQLLDEEALQCPECGRMLEPGIPTCPRHEAALEVRRIGAYSPSDTVMHFIADPDGLAISVVSEGESARTALRFASGVGLTIFVKDNSEAGSIYAVSPQAVADYFAEEAEPVENVENELVMKLGLIRMPGWEYFIDIKGNLHGLRAIRGGSVEMDGVPQRKLLNLGLLRAKGWQYYVGVDGHVHRMRP